MLGRAARAPRGRCNALARPPASFDQLILPWLCPAQARWAASVMPAASTSSKSKRTTSLRHASPRTETRSISTGTDALPPSSQPPPFSPFANHWASTGSSLASLNVLNPRDCLKINQRHITAPPRLRMEKGVGGDPSELRQNLQACLRVGRLDRAAALVRRLSTLYNPFAAELRDAHNAYLQGMLEAMSQDPINSKMRDLEDWFNKEMINKGVEPDDETLVAMIRGSLSFYRDQKRTEAVQRYLDLAKSLGDDVFRDVNTSAEFTQEEWDSLVRLQSQEFDEPTSAQDELAAAVSTPAGQQIAIEQGLMQNPATEVRLIPQKGQGMRSLKEALSPFDPSNAAQYPDGMDGSQEQKDKAYAMIRQIQLEECAVESSVKRWKHENDALLKIGIHGALKTKSMGALMWQWYSNLVPRVQKELDAVKKELANESAYKNSDRLVYGGYLELFDAKTLSALTAGHVVETLAHGANTKDSRGPKEHYITNLTVGLAKLLDLESKVQLLKSQKTPHEGARLSSSRRKILSKLSKRGQAFISSQDQKAALKSKSASVPAPIRIFPVHVQAKIGAVLIENFVRSATLTVTREDPQTGETMSSVQPAFTHANCHTRGKIVGVLRMHSELTRKLSQEPIRGQSTFRLPMVVEPAPWKSFQEGGYYRYPTKVMRTKDDDQEQVVYATSAIQKGDMDQVLAGLDVLGRTPWQINKDVFRVMVQAWNAGEGIGELVPGDIEVPLPPEPPSGSSPRERSQWHTAVKAANAKKAGLHSKRCFQNQQLEMARSYLNETIYYPHNIDFRGRAYPIPPTLNHMGADIARGLLKFGVGRELGSVGLKWLKIHMANLSGFDKASLREREEFAMENLPHIYDSATNPLSGDRWWLKAEDPWQCLACCFELKRALDSPDPTRYVSSFPVHQDGTCNGLQHYAALGGDTDGASQVNLEPSDRPQDIYTGVAELVKAAISRAAKDGDPIAKFLEGRINRKLVKRTVMTNVYGVTFEGARRQVEDELKVAMPDFVPTPGVSTLGSVAVYVAKEIFQALSKIFNGAQDIQFWLGACASRISTSVTSEQIRRLQEAATSQNPDLAFQDPKFRTPKRRKLADDQQSLKETAMDFKSSVIWTTPLRMPVVQPYRKDKITSVKTCLQSLNLVAPCPSDAVSKRKQQQAFPPNFIHSLDATHMLLSALRCSEEGLTFAAVHDSFWTHPADVPKLNEILRDAFVRMHSEDIIGRLAAEFKARYAGSIYRADLKANSPAAQQIIQWRKSLDGRKNSTRKNTRSASYDELLMEAERQRLLCSEDAEERKRGQEMVTPASIYELAQDASAMVGELKQPLLGQTNQSEAEKIQTKMISAELEVEPPANEVQASESVEEKMVIEDDVQDVDGEFDEHFDEDFEYTALNTDADDHDAAAASTRKPVSTIYRRSIHVWLPLTFPPVPKKGDFDVRRLRESKYFFS